MKKNIELFLVHQNDSLKQVMQKIDHNGHGIALVVDSQKKFMGLVTDGDIRRAIIKGISLTTSIEELMNKNPTTLNTNYTPQNVTDIITQKPNLNHLPVLDEEKKIQDILLKEEIMNITRNTSSLFSKIETSQQKIELSMKQKRILITGGAGYIGSVLTRQLLEKGYNVTVLDKFIFGPSPLESIKTNPHLTIIPGDVSHVEDIIKAIQQVDTVVHLAEIVGDPACAIDPAATQQINYLSTSIIATACKHFQINRFIYASSCSVYGSTIDEELLHEKSTTNPLSLYARMKLESERTILGLADGIFSPTILRFATVFGQSPRMRFDLVVNTLTLKAIKEGKITIFGGDQWRPLIHVADLSRAITAIIEAPLEKVKCEIFNVGGNQHNYTINHIGEHIKTLYPASDVVIQEKNIDKRNYKVDFSKINTQLAFLPSLTLQDGITEIATSLQQGNYDNYTNSIYYNDKWYEQTLKKN